MRTLTDEDHKRIYKVVCEVAGRNGVEGFCNEYHAVLQGGGGVAVGVRGDSKRTTTSCGLATSARLVIWPYLVDVTRQVSPDFAAKMAGGKRR